MPSITAAASFEMPQRAFPRGAWNDRYEWVDEAHGMDARKRRLACYEKMQNQKQHSCDNSSNAPFHYCTTGAIRS
jgi:hypothetical protein